MKRDAEDQELRESVERGEWKWVAYVLLVRHVHADLRGVLPLMVHTYRGPLHA